MYLYATHMLVLINQNEESKKSHAICLQESKPLRIDAIFVDEKEMK